jgi:hypothetical protein
MKSIKYNKCLTNKFDWQSYSVGASLPNGPKVFLQYFTCSPGNESSRRELCFNFHFKHGTRYKLQALKNSTRCNDFTNVPY